MLFPDFKTELKYLQEGFSFIIGCDEVGRGPLAGPVVAAACILDPGRVDGGDKWYARVRDSKTISQKERETLLEKILKNTSYYGIGEVFPEEIDKINIHNATGKAMQLAVFDMFSKMTEKDKSKKFMVLVDGKFPIPGLDLVQKAIVKGDGKILSISAASIIAKVHRDNLMKDLDKKYPKYGFVAHKGYGTKAHIAAIKTWGPSIIHRKSFIGGIMKQV